MDNFGHINRSKFEEALSMTLRRKQETGNKKKVKTILSRKYRSIRSDIQSQKNVNVKTIKEKGVCPMGRKIEQKT